MSEISLLLDQEYSMPFPCLFLIRWGKGQKLPAFLTKNTGLYNTFYFSADLSNSVGEDNGVK